MSEFALQRDLNNDVKSDPTRCSSAVNYSNQMRRDTAGVMWNAGIENMIDVLTLIPI